MAKKMTNKPKYWRRMANVMTMTIPHKQTITDEAGNESEVVIPIKVPVSGQQIRRMNQMQPTIKLPGSTLLMNMMERAGYLIKKEEDDTIKNESSDVALDIETQNGAEPA